MHHSLPRFRCFVSLTIAMVVSMSSSSAACIKPDGDNTWTWGLGGGSAWLQYGNQKNHKMLFTLQRSPEREAIQMVLHDASAAISQTQEIPGFIPFSFESGFHTGRDKDIIAIEGIAILQELQAGGIGLFAGNLDFPNEEMKSLRKVSKAIKSSFRFYAADTCYEIPITEEPLHVMNTLLAPHKSFSKKAAYLFQK